MSKKKRNLNDLPLYKISAKDVKKSHLTYVSLVKRPAIEVEAQYFSDENGIEPNQYFTAEESDRQVIYGPAMIANQKIYRKSPSGYEYAVVFSADVIETLVMEYFKNNGNRAINFNHSDYVVEGYIFESSFVKNSMYSAAKAYGYDLSVGSWFIGVKIDDTEIWNVVKSEGGLSFSIEGILDQILVNMSIEEMFGIKEELLINGETINLNQEFGRMYNLQPKEYESKWHTHPECKCNIDFEAGIWTDEPSEDGKYPCKICIDMKKKYETWYANKGKGGSGPSSKKFSDQEIIDDIWNKIKNNYQ